MSRRVSFNAMEFDSKLSTLAFSEDDEECTEKREKIRKIMARIIKNDLTARQRENNCAILLQWKGSERNCSNT